MIEAAVGGQPIEVTVEGRNRFSINVRYPRDLRQDLEHLSRVLIPLPMGARAPAAAASGSSAMGGEPGGPDRGMGAGARNMGGAGGMGVGLPFGG